MSVLVGLAFHGILALVFPSRVSVNVPPVAWSSTTFWISAEATS